MPPLESLPQWGHKWVLGIWNCILWIYCKMSTLIPYFTSFFLLWIYSLISFLLAAIFHLCAFVYIFFGEICLYFVTTDYALFDARCHFWRASYKEGINEFLELYFVISNIFKSDQWALPFFWKSCNRMFWWSLRARTQSSGDHWGPEHPRNGVY